MGKNDKLVKLLSETNSLVDFYKHKEAILEALGETPKVNKKKLGE